MSDNCCDVSSELVSTEPRKATRLLVTAATIDRAEAELDALCLLRYTATHHSTEFPFKVQWFGETVDCVTLKHLWDMCDSLFFAIEDYKQSQRISGLNTEPSLPRVATVPPTPVKVAPLDTLPSPGTLGLPWDLKFHPALAMLAGFVILALAMLFFSGCSAAPVDCSITNCEEAMPRTHDYKFEDYEAEALPHKTAKRGLPIVGVVTPPNGPWSRNNNLGQLVKFSEQANNTASILQMPENGPPEIWTVTLGSQDGFRTGLIQNGGYGITAQIEFGAGGATQTVEIDWLAGAQISWPCNAITVKAVYDNVTLSNPVHLTALASKGARPGGASPVKTIAQNLLIEGAGGRSLVYKIPDFAYRILVLPEVNTGVSPATAYQSFYSDDFELNLYSGNAPGAFIVSSLFFGNRAQAMMGLPVTGNARFATLYNNTADDLYVTIVALIQG